ncbi:MAG: DUF3237 domain-containing protein [Rhodospirillales bacterium]|nr:DUF3237 domain-containing protein [Rhodospirillales bacterium]
MLKPPDLEYVCTLTVQLGPPREMGIGRSGSRRIIPIIGGTVQGDALSGTILNLGADWQTVFHNDCAQLDTRYAFETTDGALIEVINSGFRHGPPDVMARLSKGEDVDPAEYYMRTHARLETGDQRYNWVNKTLFAGTGERRKASVVIALYAIK